MTTDSYILGPEGEKLEQESRESCSHFHERADDFLNEASACIRRNPVPVVLGALGVGIVIGCLIVCNRSAPTLQERANDAGESILDSATRLFENLKFW